MKKFVANDTARRKLGLLGVSALAIMLSTPAFAQDVPRVKTPLRLKKQAMPSS